MKVPLKAREWPESCRDNTRPWLKSLPFVKSRVGQLVHRVRSATNHFFGGVYDHYSVNCMCGMSLVGEPEFYDEPPPDRLVCAACERAANRDQLPSADRLAGRHCHTGSLKAFQECCREAKESN